MAVVQQYSADSLLSLLNEDDQALKLYALQSLNKVVHDFWYQIASSIASVEAFYEDEAFVHRELAAVVASKVRTTVHCAACSFGWKGFLPCTHRRLMPSYIHSLTFRFLSDQWLPGLQVFYHLGELDDALTYALGAGTLFDINEQSEYVQTLLGRVMSYFHV